MCFFGRSSGAHLLRQDLAQLGRKWGLLIIPSFGVRKGVDGVDVLFEAFFFPCCLALFSTMEILGFWNLDDCLETFLASLMFRPSCWIFGFSVGSSKTDQPPAAVLDLKINRCFVGQKLLVAFGSHHLLKGFQNGSLGPRVSSASRAIAALCALGL